MLASAVELAASRAETKVSVKDLLASAVALSLSRAETIDATKDLRAREGQITSITKNQELLLNVVEASPTALILVSASGQIAMVNAKAERMFGYARAELHGQKLEVLLPEEFRVGHVKLRTDFLTHMSSRAMGEGRELFGLRKDRTQFPPGDRTQPHRSRWRDHGSRRHHRHHNPARRRGGHADASAGAGAVER